MDRGSLITTAPAGSVAGVVALRSDSAGAPIGGRAWAPTVATLASWPDDATAVPLIERRLWRTGARGALRETVLAAMHDPLGIHSRADAEADLTELLRPLRTAHGLVRLQARHVAELRAPIVRYAAQLGELHSHIPEGGDALLPLFAELIEGLQRVRGAVAVSMLIAPTSKRPDAAEAPHIDGDGRRVRYARRVNFALRLFSDAPLSATLRARAEAVCLATRAEPGDWQIALHPVEIEDAARRIASFEMPPGALPADPEVAALTLSLPAPMLGASRLLGRPYEGRPATDGPSLGRVRLPTGSATDWRLCWEARRLHVFIAAATGMGKTTTMLRAALDDVENGRSVVLLDPHGDVAREFATAVPPDRLTLIDPRIPGTDPLDLLDPDPDRAAANILGAVHEVWPSEFAGPVFHRNIVLATRALAASPAIAGGFTLAHVDRLLSDAAWRSEVIKALPDGVLRAEMSRSHAQWQAQSTDGHSSLQDWLLGKLTPLTQGPAAPLFDRHPDRPLEVELASGRVIVVALPTGLLGGTTSLVTRMFLTRLSTAIAAQGSVPEAERQPIAVFLDEAQLLAGGPALGGLFTQSRKFGASVCIAAQVPSQLGHGLDQVLTNTSTQILGRLSRREAGLLEDRIGSAGVRALPTLPRHHLLLVEEDTDPTLDPVILTPIPPPALPELAKSS